MNRTIKAATISCLLAIAGVIALAFAPAGKAQDTRLAVFDGIEKGQWSIRFRDGSPPRSICVRSGRELLKLKHGKSGCSNVIVANEPDMATVQYSCPGDGYGRTTIRRETRALLQLSSQGIANERPFQVYAEARYQGACQ
ncbi:hypothetical protein [Altererythrobacter lutimaris]|uniref:DUF3617 family protein n=1 Tax=Altererythrobacter lutimaris TaxID=2743979 RepID=A0A850HE67_9SPHN|nr:hypothetical protein [Altererythrobacter lutimaris]NVE95118.1 hypothetical protein [Altererythrobacter lutimaris]